MLKNCPHCGAANRERATQCYVCESPLPEASPPAAQLETDPADDLARDILENIPEPVGVRTASVTELRPAPAKAVAPAATPAPASEPDWKREVAHRLEEYRSRQARNGKETQDALPFENESPEAPSQPPSASAPGTGPRASLRYSSRSKPSSPERVEIAAQPGLDFEPQPAQERPQSRLVPVAELGERLHAGLLDAGFVFLAYGGFLLMFRSLGGELGFGKVHALVYAAALFLIYAQYFVLFTAFGGCTPGMLLRRLHVAGFDGNPPTPRQLLWRSFGYLVSAAAAMVGFLWSLWDEDQLTWQDRISQTYLTESPRETAATGSPVQTWKLF